MIGNKRNFSLTILDHEDNFLCTLKSANIDFDGQSYNENFTENINGERTLTFSIPMYIFQYNQYIDEIPNLNDKNNFIQNEIWKHIYNEQKIRYIEYNAETQEKERIEEFVLKNYTESRNGEQKIADCVCESLAVYELGKIGWGITFDESYVTLYDSYEVEDNITLDYWMRKILYKETNLGRVSNTTECTYLLQGIQLRDEEGYAIDNVGYTIDEEGNYQYTRIEEPICTTTESPEYIKYFNPTGWTWEVIADFENDPEKQGISKLYENPVINKFIEGPPNFFYAQSYQKRIGESDESKILRKHPIPDNELNEWTYVTAEKRHLMNVERSNIFSIIQDLCEEFGVWAHFIYEYDDGGKIITRKILFKTEAVDDDIKFDFAYGKNLQSCSRVLDSSDLITKLYVTNTDSVLVDGGILSIQQATANPTSENYIYNFNYFYETHMLSRESEKGVHSDEYKINLHCGKLRKINDRITNTQKFLAPLYDKQLELQSNLTIQEGAKAGYVGNISDIESKIAAIPPGDRLIKSWVQDYTEYNHVGESKTFSTTTNAELGGECKYLNFGRDDILIGEITTIIDYGKPETETLIGFIPRIYSFNDSWKGKVQIPDDNVDYFTLLNNQFYCRYDYSDFGDGAFIKGIYFKKDYHNPNYNVIPNYGRVRFKYAPLAYYYLLIQDYQRKIDEVNIKIDQLETQLREVNNKIFAYELEVKSLLKDKNELILQFEKDYKPYIREGYWEPADYKPESINKILYTDEIESNFDGFVIEEKLLKELNLNDSITNYTRYFSLGNAANIKVDSIKEMSTFIPSGGETPITRMRELNFELYLDNHNNLIVAIAPDLITKYQLNNYEEEYYEGTISYETLNEGIHTVTKHWDIVPDDLVVKNSYIYLSDDDIVTGSLKVYGGHSTNPEDELLQYGDPADWNYSFESTAYDSEGHRVDISDVIDDVTYDYSLKIQLKLTNRVNQYLTVNNPKFTVSYGEETTLQYLYNDATLMSDKYSMPISQYSISVVDLSTLNGFDYYKPRVGQEVPIWDIEMGLRNFQGFITSVSFPLEEKQNTQIEITTYNTKFEDIFQKLTATVTDVKYNENEIYHAADAFEAGTGAIKTDVFQKSLEDNFSRIQLGVNNEITIDKATGITLKDLDNGSGVKIIGNGIYLTDDINKPSENVEWKTGITGDGINASAVTAGHIDTQQVYIYNASQDQMRFIWNRDGLFAYGDKFNASDEYISQTTDIDSDTELIDYDKYVKLNEQGLEFNDHGKSALKLGWKGLNIQTQNNALSLDADNGLSIQNENVKRLELGHLRKSNGDYTNVYGLKLYDSEGKTTVQTDSNGELWLKKNFNIGGSISESTGVVISANAGIYGEEKSDYISNQVPKKMQMGHRRDETGTLIWDSTPLRFWAGPRTKSTYKAEEGQDAPNDVNDNAPSLSRFKVDANGRIVASGIDVGGWIGGGTFLRSKDSEAILRSGDYIISGSTAENPVIAIGLGTSTSEGRDYNFRVTRNGTVSITKGSININNGNFIVDSSGNVTIKSGSISIGGLSASSNTTSVNGTVTGTVGGMTANANGLSFTSGSYTTAMYKIANSDSNAFVAGPTSSPTFKVTGKGKLYATGVDISGKISASTGDIGGWQIGTNILYKDTTASGVTYRTALYPNANSSNPVIYIGNSTTVTDANTNFKVTGQGAVYFKKAIYGWSTVKNGFRPGISSGTVNLQTTSGKPISIEINQGLIIDISS